MRKKLLIILSLLLSLSTFSQTQYRVQHYSVENGLSQNMIMAIIQDRDGFMWFGTWNGLDRFDGHNFVTYKIADSDITMYNKRVDQLYEDSIGEICFKTNDGKFYKINKNTNKIETVTDSVICSHLQVDVQTDSLYVDHHGIIWSITDETGISRYRNGNWKHFTPELDPIYKGQLRKNCVFLEDKNGNLWVNPTGGGFSRYNYERDELEYPIHDVSNMIHTAYVDRDGSLWISSYNNGLDRVDIGRQLFNVHDLHQTGIRTGEVRAFVELNGQLQVFTKDKMVYTALDSQQGLILGSKGQGISGINIEIDSKDIYDIEEDKDGKIYIATYGKGVYIYDPKNPTDIKQVGNEKKVRDILICDSYVLAGTTQGILNVTTSELYNYYDTRCLLQGHDGRIWVGTFGGGLNELIIDNGTPKIVHAETNSDIIMSIQEDNDGHLWFTSETHMTRYSPETHTIRNFEPLWNIKDAYFTEAEAIKLHTGELVFGFSNGYCQFDPKSIVGTEEIPPIQFTNLNVLNTERHIPSDKIELTHKEASFSISYAALDFNSHNQIQYAYMLEGFDADWNYVNDQRRATYTNIKHGKYIFHVRSTNQEGTWVDNEKTIEIEVYPSFWETGWALMLYLLIGMLLMLIIHHAILAYAHLKQEVAVEQKVTDIKLRFFTNISHELRTPLTLISGPVENILNNSEISDDVRSQLEIVESNSNRMLRMINQILDFRKVQSQKLRLKVQLTHLKPLVSETCANFNKEAYDKHINYNIENNAPDALIWVDREKVDTILFNLLSNAFKFTPEGKSVTVKVDESPENIILQVSDTGVGIPKEKHNVLFERFLSHDEINNPSSKPGTGIGLSLTKELVELHKGTIDVESEVNVGTTFTIKFRKGKEHFGNDVDIIINDGTPISVNELPSPSTNISMPDKLEGNSLLIVEDNEDMRKFLQQMFEKDFSIITASNGIEGLEKAKSDIPSLIITDLMMPNMDGDEMTREIKQDPNTCHIPIILLTAKASSESKLNALEEGADDYITKPFSPDYLQARVSNLLKQRQRLQDSYRQHLLDINQKQTNPAQAQSPNEAFLTKLMEYMEKNMDNSQLSVEDLVNEMALGRTVFFNKLKSLTGLSPVEFIREIRIKRAAQLLQDGHYNITEITYMVGMNDSRYFSKCFKAVFGKTPTEYKHGLTE